MNTQTNSTAQPSYSMPALPGDNRDERTRYLSDVEELRRMSSILLGMLDKAFDWSRAQAHDRERTILTFNFSEEWIDNIRFAASNVENRAALLEARSYLFDGEGDQ